MYIVSPKDIERFCLRLLLLHVSGAESFEALRTVNGTVHPTFQTAARELNLFEDDLEWKRCLQEAAHFQMPAQMRMTFAFILVFCHPENSLELWNDFKSSLAEDFSRRLCPVDAERATLQDINSILQSHGMSVIQYGLPDPGPTIHIESTLNMIEESTEAVRLIHLLNHLQRVAFDAIVSSVDHVGLPNVFFLDGPGGSGKTFLYNTLMAFLRGRGQSVLPYATTGIAAVLLKGGRTMHSGFKLPVPIYNNSTSRINMISREADGLREAVLLIIDEASMMTTHALSCIDRLLKELMINSRPFGGKVIVLGGDFRQTLPVVPRGSRTDIVEVCLKSSPLWSHFEVFKLIENMRATGRDDIPF